MIWVLVCGKILTHERIHTHSWDEVYQTADREELIDTKVGGVHSTENVIQLSKVLAASVCISMQ